MMSSVRVAVRARPLNKREVNLNSHVVVSMHGKVVRVSNPKSHDVNASITQSGMDNGISPVMTRSISGDVLNSPSSGDIKEFPFHFCFWSGEKSDEHYVGQEVVYHHMGEDVVKAAYDGYNACVFAYGQTGSGKTYSMMGSEEEPGLIPRICQNLFEGMLSNEEITYRVEVSYLEIYNEKVRDLLTSEGKQAPGNTPTGPSLRVREHPKDGPYVQGLSRHIANGHRDVLNLMETGNLRRTTASTNMNDTSSRSHAIFSILFTQANFCKKQPEEKYSKIHLVDLAGSERAHATGATGHRLKEGGSINKSLVLLGNVISTLSEKSTNKKVTFIPYRDSVLTWLLKDSLGGNSKTMMIATISPAACNYSETMSTLRYASRAKNIINRPEVNEDPNVKLIRELRAEIDRLRQRLEKQGHEMTGGMKERLQVNEAKVAVLTQAWTGRWRETMSILEEKSELALRPLESGTAGVVLDSTLPYLAAINTDEFSTGISLFHLKEGTTILGSNTETQDIVLTGNGILPHHCSIDTVKPGDEEQEEAFNMSVNSVKGEDDKVLYTVTLTPIGDAVCCVNGVTIEGAVKLMHGAIMQFGHSDMFRFNNPAEAKKMRREGVQNQGRERALSLLSRSLFELNKMDDQFPAPVNEIDSSIDDKRRELSEMEERLLEAENRWRREAQEKEAELEAKRKRLEELQNNLEESRSRVTSEAKKVRRVSLDMERYRNCHSPAELFAQIQSDLDEKYNTIMEQEKDRLNSESRNLEEQVVLNHSQFEKEEADLKEGLDQKQKEFQNASEEVTRLQEDLRTLSLMKERNEVTPEDYKQYESAVSAELNQQETQLGNCTVSLDRMTVFTEEGLRALAARRRAAAQDAADARHDLEIREAAMRRDLNRKMNEELATMVEELVKNSNRADIRPDAIPENLTVDSLLNSEESGRSTPKGKIGATENELMALTMQVRAAEESLIAEEQVLADKEEQVELKRWRLQQLEESRRLSMFVEEEVRRQLSESMKSKEEEVEGTEKDEKTSEEERQQQRVLARGVASPSKRGFMKGSAREMAEIRRRLEPNAFPRSASTSSSDDSSNLINHAPSLRSLPLRQSHSMMSLRPRAPSETNDEPWPKSVEVHVARYLLRSNFAEYELKAVVGLETWVVCRRYSLIREFHEDLRKLYPGIRDIEFPPRRMFWDPLERVAQERVELFETYFRRLINYLQRHPFCNLNPRKSRSPLCKKLVCNVLPILRKGEFDNTRFTTA